MCFARSIGFRRLPPRQSPLARWRLPVSSKSGASNDSSGDIAKVRDELDSAGLGQDVFVVCQTQAEAERLAESIQDTSCRDRQSALPNRHAARRLPSGHRANRASQRRRVISPHRHYASDEARLGRVIDSFLELHEGDHVVHLAHGIGKYRGLKLLEQGHVEEHLEIEFSGATKIYVPSSNIELVKSTSAEARVGRHWRMLAVRPGSIKRRRLSARCSTWPSRCFSFSDSRVAARHRLSRRHPMAARVRRSVSLPRDRRPASRDRSHQE